MKDSPDEPRRVYPPGFEPPTDVHVPWYAWVLWPVAILFCIVVGSSLFRGCMSWLS